MAGSASRCSVTSPRSTLFTASTTSGQPSITSARAARTTSTDSSAHGCGLRQHGVVQTAQVDALRALLASTGWLDRTRYFAGALRRRARTPNGLLIVGTPADEPWHMTAHLADESRFAGLPEMMPTLVRWEPPPDAPPHLAVGIERLERAGRAETLLVVSAEAAPAALLDRVADARKAGTAIFALDQGDKDLDDLASESLAVSPESDPLSFDAAQHLVSFGVAGADQHRASMRHRLNRLLNAISGP